MNRRAVISLIAGVLVSALALYLAFRNVPISDLGVYFSSVDYIWVIPATALLLLAFLLRALRWQIILGAYRHVGFTNAFHPLMIGFMINCVLPGRVGEIARPAILKKRDDIPFTTGLATVAAERALDMVFLLLLFIGVLATVEIDPSIDEVFGGRHLNREALLDLRDGVIQLSVLLVAGIVFISIGRCRDWLNRVILGFPRLLFFIGPEPKDRIHDRILVPLTGILGNIAAGFSLVRSPKRLLLCMVSSLSIWAASGLSYYVMALGCPGIGISFVEMVAVMIIICVFIALPSVPGFWGIWEAGGVFALSLFSVPSQEAAGFTLVNHAVQVFPVIFVGLGSALLTGINILQVSYRESQP